MPEVTSGAYEASIASIHSAETAGAHVPPCSRFSSLRVAVFLSLGIPCTLAFYEHVGRVRIPLSALPHPPKTPKARSWRHLQRSLPTSVLEDSHPFSFRVRVEVCVYASARVPFRERSSVVCPSVDSIEHARIPFHACRSSSLLSSEWQGRERRTRLFHSTVREGKGCNSWRWSS